MVSPRRVRELVRTRARDVVHAGVGMARGGPRGPVCMTLLVFGYVGFLVVGVAVFTALEGPEEERARNQMDEQLAAFLRNNTCVDETELVRIATVITNAHKAGIHLASNQGLAIINWNPQGAFFFVGTTVTTIGYGNTAPATVGGRVFCTIFATFGIPINLVILSKVGKLTLHGVERFGGALRKRGIKERQVRLLSGGLFLGLGFALFLLIPSAVFMAVEGWSYAESYYYAFITLSTIGFGDYVVGRLSTVQYPAFYKMMVAAWFFFGLAWVSALFTSVTTALERFLAESGRGDQAEGGCAAPQPVRPSRPSAPRRASRGRRRHSEFKLFVITEVPLTLFGRNT